MDVVFVSAEVAPFSKTGGLGDVMGALPKALAAAGHRVMVVTPRYLSPATEARYAGAKDLGVHKRLDLGLGGAHDVTFWHMHKEGVDYVFVDHIAYHRPGNPYGNAHGPYADNLFRFALLSMAAVEAPLILPIGGYRHKGEPGEPYGQKCVFVANDWHAAMVPVYLAARFRPHNTHTQSRCVLALHNLAHQGSYPSTAFSSLGLGGEWYGAMEWVVNARNASGQGTSAVRNINVLKAGLVTADKVVTVSQNYAAEICDEAGQGQGLASLLQQRADQLRGITNGVDYGEWDPAADEELSAAYTRDSLVRGKGRCKFELQRELGLPPDPERPLLGFIGRLDYQKGPDLVLGALPALTAAGCQVVILGSGAQDYEELCKQAEKDYPYHVRAVTEFDVPLSHRIMGGIDILLMPSRFEPCGLNQMYAMRYGTVPVAHSTGGLRDTIDDFNVFAPPGSDDRGTGWTFAPATIDAFTDSVLAAVHLYSEEPKEWRALQQRCMGRDFSWGAAARQYETVFAEVMGREQEDMGKLNAKAAAAIARQTVVLKAQADKADKEEREEKERQAKAAAAKEAAAKAAAAQQQGGAAKHAPSSSQLGPAGTPGAGAQPPASPSVGAGGAGMATQRELQPAGRTFALDSK